MKTALIVVASAVGVIGWCVMVLSRIVTELIKELSD